MAIIPYRAETIRKQMSRLEDPKQLSVRYEAGSTGYGLYRLLKAIDICCEVFTPSLIQQKLLIVSKQIDLMPYSWRNYIEQANSLLFMFRV